MNTDRIVIGEDERRRTADDASPASKAGDMSALQADLAAARKALLQLGEDFDAYKEGIQRQSPKQPEAEKESILREILPILDHLESALNSAPSAQYQEARQDIKSALHCLHQLLHNHGIETADDIGHPFDPLLHELVGEKCDPARQENTILHVAKCGYLRGSEVFRPAKVIVNVLTEPTVGDGS